MDNLISRRLLLQFGAAAAGAATLSGCVSPGDPSAKGSAGASDGPLKPGGKPAGELTILDDNTNKVFQASAIAAFQSATGIKVKTYTMGNFNDLHDRFATLF